MQKRLRLFPHHSLHWFSVSSSNWVFPGLHVLQGSSYSTLQYPLYSSDIVTYLEFLGYLGNRQGLLGLMLEHKVDSIVKEFLLLALQRKPLRHYTGQSKKRLDVSGGDPLLFSWLWYLRRYSQFWGPGTCSVGSTWWCCSIPPPQEGRIAVNSGLCVGIYCLVESSLSRPPLKAADLDGASSHCQGSGAETHLHSVWIPLFPTVVAAQEIVVTVLCMPQLSSFLSWTYSHFHI